MFMKSNFWNGSSYVQIEQAFEKADIIYRNGLLKVDELNRDKKPKPSSFQ